MEGEFLELAQRIAGVASDGGIDVSHLRELVGSRYGEINCYPGSPSDLCCDLAVFISLHGRLAKKKWPLNFEAMLKAFVQHMQGMCSETTRHAVIITDSWWSREFEQWAGNLRTISQSSHVETYLIGCGGWVTPIRI
jgi:hypothetical protein